MISPCIKCNVKNNKEGIDILHKEKKTIHKSRALNTVKDSSTSNAEVEEYESVSFLESQAM